MSERSMNDHVAKKAVRRRRNQQVTMTNIDEEDKKSAWPVDHAVNHLERRKEKTTLTPIVGAIAGPIHRRLTIEKCGL